VLLTDFEPFCPFPVLVRAEHDMNNIMLGIKHIDSALIQH